MEIKSHNLFEEQSRWNFALNEWMKLYSENRCLQSTDDMMMAEQLQLHASDLQHYSQELKEVNDAPEQAQEALNAQIIRTPSNSAIWKWRIWVKKVA